MKIPLSCFLLSCAVWVYGAKPGDTYDEVIAEKGQPSGQMAAGSIRVLNYSDLTIKLRDNVVVEVKEGAGAPSLTSVQGAKTAPQKKPRAQAQASAAEWTTDASAAMQRAQSEHRNVFLFFTGSNWCGWCKRLEREILSTNEFRQYAGDKLVLVTLDFPRGVPQPDDLKAQNESLSKKYGIRGFPTVIVLNPAGKVVKQLGYQEGGPEPFIAALKSVE